MPRSAGPGEGAQTFLSFVHPRLYGQLGAPRATPCFGADLSTSTADQ